MAELALPKARMVTFVSRYALRLYFVSSQCRNYLLEHFKLTNLVLSLEKNKLAFITLTVGLALLFFSWYNKYPISFGFPGDIVFNHISPFYWVSLPLVLGSLFILGVFSKSQSLKCVVSIGIIFAIYSLSYFYFSLPTGDSQYFTGLVQNFINTKSLDSSQLIHEYYSWPAFFLLADVVTSVSGLSVISYEFLLYAIIGSLLGITLYVYTSKLYPKGAIFAVVAFFISMFYFLNYQAVPFSLALALLFILFMLETQKKSTPVTVTILIMFFGISLAHSFVALFFILYLLFRTIISRSKLYAELCLVTTNVFLITQFTFSSYWIGLNIASLFRLPSDYGSIVSSTLNTQVAVPSAIDVLSQNVSRLLTVLVVLVCLVGFIFLLIKRKLRAVDGAIFLAGAIYSIIGLAVSSLGERALAILVIPVCLGITYLFNTRFKSYLIGLFLILLILFVAVPIHSSFGGYPITFQSKNDLTTANFIIEKYNWNSSSFIIADVGMSYYISTQIQGKTIVDASNAARFGLANFTDYDSIIYSVGLANSLQSKGISIENNSQLLRFDVVYNSGSSYIAIKSK